MPRKTGGNGSEYGRSGQAWGQKVGDFLHKLQVLGHFCDSGFWRLIRPPVGPNSSQGTPWGGSANRLFPAGPDFPVSEHGPVRGPYPV